MLADVPSFGRNPRGPPDFLAYPVPKACERGLGYWVPRCLGVARSASLPKAALVLGCSHTPGLRSCLAGSPAWHGLPQCPGHGHWVSYRHVACALGFGARPPLASPGFGFGFGTCPGLGSRLPASCAGGGLRCVRVDVGCARFAHAWLQFPVLVFGCGLRGWSYLSYLSYLSFSSYLH